LLSLLLSLPPFVSQPDFDLLALFPDKELCHCFLCARALKLNTTPHDTLPSFLDVLSMHSCLSLPSFLLLLFLGVIKLRLYLFRIRFYNPHCLKRFLRRLQSRLKWRWRLKGYLTWCRRLISYLPEGYLYCLSGNFNIHSQPKSYSKSCLDCLDSGKARK